jgi:RNA polymerase sigma factor (sigma-70 family)
MAAAESMVAARRALDDLYRSHAAEVYRYAYAVLGNHADAEDVTQTTFVNALRALERGERPRKPSNWLITITHNIVRQRFRQQQSRPAEVELIRDVAQEPAESNGPSMEELVRALQRIPQNQREALVLRELEGRSYDEIAQTLNLTKGALETLLFRARRSLADELENAATCDRAELSLSRQLDGRISRKERKRLLDHIAECPACARLQVTQGKQRRAFKGLALLPLPFALTFFKGAPSASAATGLPTIGAAGSAAVVGGGGGAAVGGGVSLGGFAMGSVALKAAAVVAAASVAGGVGIVGAREVDHNHTPAKSQPAGAGARTPAASLGATAGSRTQAQRRAARVQRAGIASARGSRTKATHGSSTTHSQKSQSAAAPGHLKAPKDVVKVKPAHPTPGPHAPATASDTTKPVNTPPPAKSKTNGQATTDKPAKSGATPAEPATPASPGAQEPGTPTTPATPATSATSADGQSNGSKAGGDPPPAPKGNSKDS